MPLPPTALAGLRPVPDIDAPPAQPDAQGGEPDNDEVKPEWVDYATEAENCKNCEYLQGSQCSVLNIQVGPDDHCNAFSAKQQQGAPDQSQAGPPEEEESGYPQ